VVDATYEAEVADEDRERGDTSDDRRCIIKQKGRAAI